MNREDLIKKWLDHNLNLKEQTAFEALDDYEDLVKLSKSLKGFKAPGYKEEPEFKNIKTLLKSKSNSNWLRPLLKVAAVLLFGLSVFYYNSKLNTTIETLVTQQTIIELPDASKVELNALSNLTYNKSKWDKKRQVILDGEAFFRVAKGAKFDVKTNQGIVSVLGTEFNVKQRENYFEVTCFEGLVAVTYNKNTVKLKPGNRFAVIDGEIIANEKENKTQPSWTKSESAFTNRPFKFVINEFQRHYNIKIETNKVDTELLFTGGFPHKDIDLALKSITLPLGITYSKTKTVIVLKGE
jgi:ferric-dicitrate binding protein FerR (iron transport regulator)